MLILKEPAITILMIFSIAFFGYLLGRIRIFGISLSTSAVFLVGLVFGHFGVEIPSSVQMTGMAIFMASVGLSAGSSFLDRMKKNGIAYFLICLCTAFTGSVICLALIWGANIEMPVAIGMMTGAFTSSPGFAAAKEAVSASAEAMACVAAGYGIMYPFGALCKVLFVQAIPKLLHADMEYERSLIAMPAIVKVSDSKKEPIEIAPMGFFALVTAIATGMILGSIVIPIPNFGQFSLGMTGGPLIMGLLLGHFGHIGPVSLKLNPSVINPLKEIGLILFFAGAGAEGGKSLVKILTTYGAALPLLGLFLIFVPFFLGFLISRKVLKLPLLNGLGAMTASMTCTPSLAALIQTAGTDDVAAAYATTYPIAMINMVIVVQLLARIAV